MSMGDPIPLQSTLDDYAKSNPAVWQPLSVSTLSYTVLPTIDLSELATGPEVSPAPAPEPPRRLHDDIPLSDWQKGCKAVMKSPYLPY